MDLTRRLRQFEGKWKWCMNFAIKIHNAFKQYYFLLLFGVLFTILAARFGGSNGVWFAGGAALTFAASIHTSKQAYEYQYKISASSRFFSEKTNNYSSYLRSIHNMRISNFTEDNYNYFLEMHNILMLFAPDKICSTAILLANDASNVMGASEVVRNSPYIKDAHRELAKYKSSFLKNARDVHELLREDISLYS